MPRSTKRPRIIGPFFLIAILLSAGIFYWQKHKNEQALDIAPPAVVERQVIDVPETDIAPSPEILTAHAKELRLTAAQSRRIEPLVKVYVAEMKPLQAEAQAATARFQAYQQSRSKTKQVPMAELQEQMGEVSQLSGRMLALRRQYWGQIAPILSKEQQRQARELWAQSFKPKTAPAPSPTRSKSS
ncbi:MAG: hypothetical protein ACYC63_11735 [Armatimonadota bacterium]